MLAVLLAAALCAGPVPLTRTDRLAQYIVEVSPEAEPYAVELAARIVWEARHYRLDVALFAAIGYLESRYLLYPHGGGPGTHLAAPWQVYPTPDWLRIPRAERMRLSRSVVVSTGRAALVLANHVRRCRVTGPACYCRYNRRPCRRGYIVALWRQARVIRAALNPPRK